MGMDDGDIANGEGVLGKGGGLMDLYKTAGFGGLP